MKKILSLFRKPSTVVERNTIPHKESDAIDDLPPPYSKVDQTAQPQRPPDGDAAVKRLRRFSTWRLAVDYNLTSRVPKSGRLVSREHSHFADLPQKYCMLLGTQLSTRNEITQVKQALMRDVFGSAASLSIPPDVTEFFLFSFRIITKRYHARRAFDRDMCYQQPHLFITGIAMDYTIMFGAVIHDDNLARELIDKCLELHQLYFGWMLSPRFIELKKGTEVLQPSFFATSREPGDWPNMAHLIRQSWRSCAQMMDPTKSPGYCVDYESFINWRDKQRVGMRVPQPKIGRCTLKLPYPNALPTTILCAWL